MRTPQEQLAEGKRARQQCPRHEQAQAGRIHRDPLPLIEASSQGRVKALVPLRYGRMLVSPYTFYRGNALLQAHDLAGTADMGLVAPICGDAHLMNFGGFATPERNLVFGVNDFDEAHPGPWEWDLKRLVASFLIAARDLGHGDSNQQRACHEVVDAYQRAMAACADQGALETWYNALTYEAMVGKEASKTTLAHVERTMQKARKRTHAKLLPKITERTEDGHLLIRDNLPEIFHLHQKTTLLDADDDWLRLNDWHPLQEAFMRDYLPTLQADRRDLLSRFTVQDLAFKVVGVGSVGTRCLVLLLTDAQQQPLFLQLKEARRSVLADYVKLKTPILHQGQRVVDGQRLMQSASDLFLGWTRGPTGHDFYVRQLRDMKVSAEIESFDADTFVGYARLCGRALARGHAKASGKAALISGYIGKSAALAEALFRYAQICADQNEQDYERFRRACKEGRLEARSEADFVAQHPE